MATKKKTQRFVLLSPDGIPIHPTNSYTHSRKMVVDFRKWASNFKEQGYYSSNYGRIPLYNGKRYQLSELWENCTMVEEKDKYKIGRSA